MKIYVYLIVFFIYVSKTWDWDSLEVLNKRITRDPSQAALLLIYNLITNHFDRRAATHSHSHTYVITLKLGIYKGVKSKYAVDLFI